MLLEPGKIGKLHVPNRIMLSPHGTNYGGENGEVTDELIAYYQRRAEGGAGTIMYGTARVATLVDGMKMMARQLSIDNDSYIPGYLRLNEAIHREGSKSIIQLQIGSGAAVGTVGGAGKASGTGNAAEMGKWYMAVPAVPVSPSGIAIPGCPEPRELSTADVEDIVAFTAKGAYRAKLAGFDGVEINANTPYLLAQFMSPVYNKRADRYGQDRLRLFLEMVAAVRESCGQDFPIIARYKQATWPFPLDESFEELEEVKEAQVFARRLEEAGVDALHTSYGYVWELFPEPSSHWPENFCIPLAKAIKKAVSIPVILTGRVRDPDLAESILHDGDADFIAMVRALIADPDLPRKYANGQVTTIWSCIGCNECFRSIELHSQVHCAVNPTAGRELLFDYRKLIPAAIPKEVMVIGAGSAGMEAARVAALRGHHVTLVEKEHHLGDKLELASRLPGRKTFKDIISYYTTAFKALGTRVEIALDSELTPELVTQMGEEGMLPDVFILATGGKPVIPEIPGVTGDNVITFIDAVADEAKLGEKVVVVGANIIGCEIALLLAQQEKKVTLVELPGFHVKSDLDGLDVEGNIGEFITQELRAQTNIDLLAADKFEKITDGRAFFLDTAGNELSVDAETVILSLGFTQTDDSALFLSSTGKEVHKIGNAVKTGKIIDAAYEGFVVASRI